MKELISVIIPVYNMKLYLKRCLDSVVSQTYRNIEIVLVDDGSTDGSTEICDEYANEDSRIKVIHTVNQGVSNARNIGLKKATGDYIGFVDPDDYIDQYMYEDLLRVLIENDCEISICAHCELFEDENTRNIVELSDNCVISADEGVRELIHCNTFKGYLWNKLYKAELFDDIEFPNLTIMEDGYVNYKVFLKSNLIALVNKPLYYYVRHSESVTRTKSVRKLIEIYQFHSLRHDELKDIFDNELSTLNTYRIKSAFSLLIGIRFYKAYNKYSDVYDEAYDFIKHNLPLFDNCDLSRWFKLRITLFLKNWRLMFWVNRLYNLLKYRKYTPELL